MEQQPACSCGVFPLSKRTFLLMGLNKLIITQICQMVTTHLLTLGLNYFLSNQKKADIVHHISCFLVSMHSIQSSKYFIIYFKIKTLIKHFMHKENT